MEALIYSETTFYQGRLNIFEKGIFVAWFESLNTSKTLALFKYYSVFKVLWHPQNPIFSVKIKGLLG